MSFASQWLKRSSWQKALECLESKTSSEKTSSTRGVNSPDQSWSVELIQIYFLPYVLSTLIFLRTPIIQIVICCQTQVTVTDAYLYNLYIYKIAAAEVLTRIMHLDLCLYILTLILYIAGPNFRYRCDGRRYARVS